MERILLRPLATPAYDAGLRRHMIGIYRVMALGLLVTAAVAFGVASSPALTAAIVQVRAGLRRGRNGGSCAKAS